MNLRKDFWLVTTLLTAFPAIILLMIGALFALGEIGQAKRPNSSEVRSVSVVLITPQGGFLGAVVFGSIASFCYWRYRRQLRVER
jgi:hypothetical protein